MSNLTFDLSYWINERECMRIRKEESGLTNPPLAHGWSADKFMGSIRYCNVRREDDKVTRWIAKNWRNGGEICPTFVPAMILARLVNWPDTLRAIGFPYEWHPEKVKKVIRERAASGAKTWSSAYIVSTCGRSMPKEDYVVDHVVSRAMDMDWDVPLGTSLSQMYDRLCRVDGLGSFLAAQVVADLKNTPQHPLKAAPDWQTWCAPGPGSLRGLSWFYYGHENYAAHYRKGFEKAARECYEEIEPMLTDYVKPLHMQDFQNCLCEFSKYMRARSTNGYARNKYRAG